MYMSVDFSETDDLGQTEQSMVTIQHENTMDGIQIVDPNNRYHQPMSKLHESNAELTMALNNDESIQHFPDINQSRDATNAQVFYASNSNLDLKTENLRQEESYRSTTSGIGKSHLQKSQIGASEASLN